MASVAVRGVAGWIESGVIAWMEMKRYEDKTALGYFRGIGPAGMAEGLITQHRPPFARGDVAPGEWGGVVVHHMHNPSRDGFDPIDHRTLCPAGAELVVFESHPCVGRAHGPKAYHHRDGRVSSRIDYENPAYVGEYGPKGAGVRHHGRRAGPRGPVPGAASDSTDLRPLGSRLRRTATPSRWTATS